MLVLVLVHSVAIPRSEGILTGDSWKSARPTTVDELRTTRISSEERRLALQRLRAAGLIQSRRVGRETICSLRPEAFGEVAERERAILGLGVAS